MRHAFVVSLVVLVAQSPGLSQNKPDERHLTLQPAPLPDPAMKYRFIPDAADQTAGNAAPLYLMAFAAAPLDSKRLEELEDTPTAGLRKAGAAEFLPTPALSQLRVATRRAACQWDSSYRELGFDWNASYLNQARWMTNVLRIKERLELSEGRYDDAVATLQDGFTLAANLSHEAPLVQALVATGIESALLQNTEELIAAKGSPNLYWALASLPRPLIDRRQVMELEAGQLFFTFPELRHVEELPADRSRQILVRAIAMGKGSGTGEVVEGLAHMIRVYPQAREALVHSGMDRSRVEAMPANTVVLAFDVMQYRQVAQDFERAGALPYWQALALLQQADARLQQLKSQGNPLVSLFPAFLRANFHYAAVDREAAMLMCVEGVRAYAAAHDGNAPHTLDDLSPQTPAPLDPLLGKAFEYEANGQFVTLRAPAPSGADLRQERVYRITVAR